MSANFSMEKIGNSFGAKIDMSLSFEFLLLVCIIIFGAMVENV